MELCVVASPIGPIEISEEEGFIVGLHHRAQATPTAPATPLLSLAAQQLEQYFAGCRRVFDLPLNISEPPFIKKVLETLRDEVPYGSTVSYGELAAMAGSPGAARAVGSAMRRNPFVIVIPCHRVLRAGLQLGNYSAGGPDNKSLLLRMEGAVL